MACGCLQFHCVFHSCGVWLSRGKYLLPSQTCAVSSQNALNYTYTSMFGSDKQNFFLDLGKLYSTTILCTPTPTPRGDGRFGAAVLVPLFGRPAIWVLVSKHIYYLSNKPMSLLCIKHLIYSLFYSHHVI